MIMHLLPMLQSGSVELTPEQQAAAGAAGLAILGVLLLIYAAIGLVLIVSMWKLFSKAGEPGWASMIPFYNIIVALKISGKPWWWLFLIWFPLFPILAAIGLAKNFGKSGGFAVGIIFLSFVFLPILAFGDARFQGQKG